MAEHAAAVVTLPWPHKHLSPNASTGAQKCQPEPAEYREAAE